MVDYVEWLENDSKVPIRNRVIIDPHCGAASTQHSPSSQRSLISLLLIYTFDPSSRQLMNRHGSYFIPMSGTLNHSNHDDPPFQ